MQGALQDAREIGCVGVARSLCEVEEVVLSQPA